MFLRKLISTESISSLLLYLALTVGILHRGGISLQSHILFSFLIGLFGFICVYKILKDKNIKFNLTDFLLFLFSIFFLLSFIFSKTQNYGLLEVAEILVGVIIFFSISKKLFSQKFIDYFLNFTIFVISLSTILGFKAYFMRPFDRFAGTFQDFRESFSAYPNAYADFQLMLLPFMAYMFFQVKNSFAKILLALIFILNLSGFILAESKGAMIAGLGMVGMFLIGWVINFFQKKNFDLPDSRFHGNDKLRKDIFVFIFICLFAFGFAYRVQNYHESKFPKQNLKNLSNEQITELEQHVSESSRIDFWKGSIAMVKSNDYSYIFGYGPYSFKFIYPQYQAKLLALSDHPHNIFLKYLVENGVIVTSSFIIFLILIFGSFIMSFLRRQESINTKADNIQSLAFLSLSGFLAHQLIDYNLNFTSNVILFWFLMGVLSVQNSELRAQSILIQNSKFKIKNLVILFSILYSLFLLLWSIHDGYYSYMFQKARASDQSNDFKNAYIYYEKSQNIWLKRDHSLSFAKLLVSSNIPANIDEAFDILWDSLKLNNEDGRVFNELGLIYLNKNYSYNDQKQANNEFLIATQRDPKNNLEYYYNELSTIPDDFFDKRYLTFINQILTEYLSLLKLNAYNTILTNNPEYAILIADKILQKLHIDCEINKNDFCELKNNLIETKKTEEEKISIYNSFSS